jgi:hypothetical protein
LEGLEYKEISLLLFMYAVDVRYIKRKRTKKPVKA